MFSGTAKGYLAVGTSSQYILQSFFSIGNLNDGKAAIPLLKGGDVLPFHFYAIKQWTLVTTMILFMNKYIEWEISQSLPIIRKTKGNQLVLINILPQLVFASILTVT